MIRIVFSVLAALSLTTLAQAATVDELLTQLPDFWIWSVFAGFCGGFLQYCWLYRQGSVPFWPLGVMTITTGGAVAAFAGPLALGVVGDVLQGQEIVGASRALLVGFLSGVLGVDLIDIINLIADKFRSGLKGRDDAGDPDR